MRGLSRCGRIHTPRGGPGRLDPVQLGEALAGRSHSNVTTPPACLSPTQLSNSVRGSEASTSNAEVHERNVDEAPHVFNDYGVEIQMLPLSLAHRVYKRETTIKSKEHSNHQCN